MPKPSNKQELLLACVTNFEILMAIINDLDIEQRTQSFNFNGLNKNIRDVVCHIHHWHLLFIGWYEIGMKNEKPEMPYKGYKWKDTSKLNQMINKKYKDTSLNISLELVNSSHKKALDIIDFHSNHELFTKKLYAWTGSTSLGAYLISNTSSHYNWGIRIIKKGFK